MDREEGRGLLGLLCQGVSKLTSTFGFSSDFVWLLLLLLLYNILLLCIINVIIYKKLNIKNDDDDEIN